MPAARFEHDLQCELRDEFSWTNCGCKARLAVLAGAAPEPWKVHNHGTEDGPGLACPEIQFAGKLVGRCMGPQVREQEPLMWQGDDT